jgi:hypothetical protein
MLGTMRRRVPVLSTFALASTLAACAGDPSPASDTNDVVVDTESDQAWAQFVANHGFASSYAPRCRPFDPSTAKGPERRPRVLVTGFGRFLDIRENATGRIVEAFLPGIAYPLTEPPAEGQVDDPAPQTVVDSGVITLPASGEVEVCAMILPVFWDLAGALVLSEIESFAPDLVIMNGVAGYVQPMWLELGAVNEAVGLEDGSGVLAAVPGSPVLHDVPDTLDARPNLLSWDAVRAAAEAEIALRAGSIEAGRSFGEVLSGVRFAGFPRSSNTYLCNDTTYLVSTVLDHPGHVFRVMEPSHPREGGPDGLDVSLTRDGFQTPRVFVHWPSSLRGAHLQDAAGVLRAMVDAQLSTSEPATRGEQSRAEVW